MLFHNKNVREIVVHYQVVKKNIINIMLNSPSQLKIDKEFEKLDTYVSKWLDKNVKGFYKNGSKDLDTEYINSITTKFNEKLTKVNESARISLNKNIKQFTSLDVAGLTLSEKKQLYMKTLHDKQLFVFVTKTGRKLQLDNYLQMVTNGIAIQTRNQAVIDRVVGLGKDLVQISSHMRSCSICQPYEGKIYSISGNSEQYPKLPFGEYLNFHPNCFHILHSV